MSIKDEMRYLQYCFQNRKDSRFVKNVMELGTDASLVNMLQFGQSQPERLYYYIAPDATGSGFFADHNRLLAYLYYADFFGLCPVVEYSEEYSYAEDRPINGTCNPFEYYFEQPGDVSLDEIKKSKAVIKSRKENAALVGKLNKTGNGYDFSEKYIDALADITEKYIHLNATMKPWMEEQIQESVGNKKTLGVHVRGTDFKRNYKGHPVKVTTEEYLKKAKMIFEEQQYERVFLATDDLEAVAQFESVFENKLYYYEDVIRSDGNETVMKSEKIRDNHHFLLGQEVLRDMCTLAACDGMVAGLSQVSLSARIWKKSNKSEYRDLYIFDKGMNRKGEICKG